MVEIVNVFVSVLVVAIEVVLVVNVMGVEIVNGVVTTKVEMLDDLMLVLVVNVVLVDIKLDIVQSCKLLLKYIILRNSVLKALVFVPTVMIFLIIVFIVFIASESSKPVLEQEGTEWYIHKYLALNDFVIACIISCSIFVISDFSLSLFLRELINSSDCTTNSSF